jgi:hypothetical protein
MRIPARRAVLTVASAVAAALPVSGGAAASLGAPASMGSPGGPAAPAGPGAPASPGVPANYVSCTTRAWPGKGHVLPVLHRRPSRDRR